MASYVQGNQNSFNGTNQTSLAVSLTGVTAGNLIVAYVCWRADNITPTVSDGTTSFTGKSRSNNSGSGLYGQMFYLLSANGGDKTFTASFSPNADYPSIQVLEFSAQNYLYDSEGTGGAYSGTVETSAFDIASDTEVVVGGCQFAGSIVTSDTERINAVDATKVQSPSFRANIWYRLPNATFTGGTATARVLVSGSPASADWCANAVAFKPSPAAPTQEPFRFRLIARSDGTMS